MSKSNRVIIATKKQILVVDFKDNTDINVYTTKDNKLVRDSLTVTTNYSSIIKECIGNIHDNIAYLNRDYLIPILLNYNNQFLLDERLCYIYGIDGRNTDIVKNPNEIVDLINHPRDIGVLKVERLEQFNIVSAQAFDGNYSWLIDDLIKYIECNANCDEVHRFLSKISPWLSDGYNVGEFHRTIHGFYGNGCNPGFGMHIDPSIVTMMPIWVEDNESYKTVQFELVDENNSNPTATEHFVFTVGDLVLMDYNVPHNVNYCGKSDMLSIGHEYSFIDRINRKFE